MAVMIGGMSLGLAGPLITRLGARTVLPPSLIAMAAGLALLIRALVDGHFAPDVLPSMILIGAVTPASVVEDMHEPNHDP